MESLWYSLELDILLNHFNCFLLWGAPFFEWTLKNKGQAVVKDWDRKVESLSSELSMWHFNFVQTWTAHYMIFIKTRHSNKCFAWSKKREQLFLFMLLACICFEVQQKMYVKKCEMVQF